MFLGFGIYIGLLCLLISNSLDTQVILISILTEVQHSEKAVFSFEKGSNCQNHSSSGSNHPVKNFSPSKKANSHPTGRD